MPEPASRPPLRRWVIAAAGAAGVLLTLGVVFAAFEAGGRSGAGERQLPEAPNEQPEGGPQPTKAEIDRLHVTLIRIDSACSQEPVPPAQRRLLVQNARAVVRFADTYPQARFRIDDEWASRLSLLLVTRQALRSCNSAAAAIVDRALPRDFRQNR